MQVHLVNLVPEDQKVPKVLLAYQAPKDHKGWKANQVAQVLQEYKVLRENR